MEINLINALIIALVIQLFFFIFAAIKKTDTVTDLSYGLTFVILAILSYFSSDMSLGKLLLTAAISIWGIRLAGFLFFRIRKLKKDKRFDGIRENFFKFAQFWLFQGIAVWVISISSLIFLNKDSNSITLNIFSYISIFISLIGILLESIADMQKYQFKNNPANNGHWTNVGLYKYSRHPNYLGELLMWWGVFGFVAQSLTGIEWIGIVSPLAISFLLIFVTGIPTTEKRNDEIYKNNEEYTKYKRSTGLLLPKF